MRILIVSKPTADNFIRHYARHLPGSVTLLTRDVREVREALPLYDLVIYEWANDLTALCLSQIRHHIPAVVRIHDHEVRLGRVHRIPWAGVAAAWFINPDIQAGFAEMYPRVPSFFLPNAVDPGPFQFAACTDKNMCLLSIYARRRKRIDRALKLAVLLPDWTLTIRTMSYAPDADDGPVYIGSLKNFCAGLPNVVWQERGDEFTLTGYPTDDVAAFFASQAVVLSTSEHEGFGYSIAEGALCGCVPCVYPWEYGRPAEFWEPYLPDANSDPLTGMAARIRAMESRGLQEAQAEARQYVIDRYSPDVLAPKLIEKLNAI